MKKELQDLQIDSLTTDEIYNYIESIKAQMPFRFDNKLSLLVSEAYYNPVDFNNPDGNTREQYDYRLEKEYIEGKTFYITALEALMFPEHFSVQKVSVNSHTILPLKYFAFRDYGVLAEEKTIKKQIEWDVQKFYQQYGLLS
jgi:hypothetical protein